MRIREEPPVNFPVHEQPSDATDCSSDVSSLTTGNSDDNNNNNHTHVKVEYSQDMFPQMDEDFWFEVLSTESSEAISDFGAVGVNQELHYLSPPTVEAGSSMHDNMEFWYNLLSRSGELPDLLPDI
ncbi:myb-related protein Myb4-like [Tripterygium wilfordii]|uniref:Myb-related protein Myb4-like n=1 Tax=Tripterygium wilfordii TaxID=458696 RepID=A0A7J7BYT0_TRIWF|nr:myb-related protein Myb4-like [Tripterygium wilfordii]